jgi:hypothetical protein
MDEAEIAKALQTDLNFHKVRIQAKCTNHHLHILATRAEEYAVNYDFLFLLVQSRLEQLRAVGISTFVLYGRKVGDKLPEWQKSGALAQVHSLENAETLIVVDGRVENTQVSTSQPQILNQIYNKSFKRYALLLIPIAILLMAGSWYVVDRLGQRQKLTAAQIIESKTDPTQLIGLEQLISDRQAINNAIAQLQTIPDRPGSLFGQAQTEISKLQAKLVLLDQKIAIEQPAAIKLESAKKLAKEASIIVQNPPHKLEVWRSALAKWLESLKFLETIPKNTSAYTEATKKLSLYRINYRDITIQLQNQLYADAQKLFLPNLISDGIAPEMIALKASGISRTEFMSTCLPFVGNNLDAVEVQKQNIQIMPFSEYICDRF